MMSCTSERLDQVSHKTVHGSHGSHDLTVELKLGGAVSMCLAATSASSFQLPTSHKTADVVWRQGGRRGVRGVWRKEEGEGERGGREEGRGRRGERRREGGLCSPLLSSPPLLQRPLPTSAGNPPALQTFLPANPPAPSSGPSQPPQETLQPCKHSCLPTRPHRLPAKLLTNSCHASPLLEDVGAMHRPQRKTIGTLAEAVQVQKKQ